MECRDLDGQLISTQRGKVHCCPGPARARSPSSWSKQTLSAARTAPNFRSGSGWQRRPWSTYARPPQRRRARRADRRPVLAAAGCATVVDGKPWPRAWPPAHHRRPARRLAGPWSSAAVPPCACQRARSAASSTVPGRLHQTRRCAGEPGADPASRPPAKDRLAGDQPGWAGESGVNAAVSLLETFPEQVRERFDVVGFDPRGSARRRRRCGATRRDNDADRADPQVDYSPPASSTSRPARSSSCSAASTRWARSSGQRRHRQRGQDLDAAGRPGRSEADLPWATLYGTRIGAAYAEASRDKVRAMILDGAVDPERRPDPGQHQPGGRLPKAFDDFAADCAKHSGCPLAPARPRPSPSSRTGEPAGEQAGQDRRSARAGLQRRDDRNDHGALQPDAVDPPRRRAEELPRAAATPCSPWPTPT